MTMTTQDNPAARRSHRDRDFRAHQHASALFHRLSGCASPKRRPRGSSDFSAGGRTKPERSVFAEARSSACAAVGYAFQA